MQPLKLVSFSCLFFEPFFLFLTLGYQDVHQFDAHEIPFDGPTGIVARVEQLLASASGLGDGAKQRLLDKFIRIILQQA